MEANRSPCRAFFRLTVCPSDDTVVPWFIGRLGKGWSMLTLPWWMSLLTGLVFACLGVGYGKRLHRLGATLSAKARVRDMPLIPVSLLLFMASLFASHWVLSHPQWGWYVPAAVEYHLLPLFWGVKIALITFAMVSISVLAFLNHRIAGSVLLVVVGVFIFGLEITMRYVNQPHLEEMRVNERDGMIFQSTASTCAAAACANIATRLGVPKGEAEMAELLHTTWAGTSPGQIVWGMRKLGFSARKAYSPRLEPEDIQAPAVFLFNFGTDADAHAVAFMGMKDGKAEIWDPVSGKILMTAEMLRIRWLGRAIEVTAR